MMYRTPDEHLATSRNLDRAEVVRVASGARAGSLKLHSGDLELDTGLGPEISDSAPIAYHRSIVLRNPTTTRARVAGDLRVGVSSDLQGPGRDGLACATASLQSLEIDVTAHLRLRASAVSAQLELSKEGMRIRSAVDVALHDAVLEIEGLDPILLPSTPAPNSRIRAELLEPLGIRLVMNAQVLQGTGLQDRTAHVAALRLSFGRSVLRGIQHAGAIEVGVASADLRLELGRPASALTGWSSATLLSPPTGIHRPRRPSVAA